MQETALIERKDLREQVIDRVEVLDKVKQLFLIPGMDVMTIKQVAEYYEVGYDTFQKCYKRNETEFKEDGVNLKKQTEFKRNGHYVRSVKMQGKSVFTLDSGQSVEVNNRGAIVFPKRAILRAGMLLRDSNIAREVRTQLLNLFEKINDEQRVIDIEHEQDLYLRLGRAAAEGTKEEYMEAAKAVFDYKNRYINTLNEDNINLTTSNRMLTAEILEWQERDSINRAIRVIASIRNVPFGFVWKELYDELQYKHHIRLKSRGPAPYMQHVKENEWPKVQKSLSAICENNGISVATVFKKSKISFDEDGV